MALPIVRNVRDVEAEEALKGLSIAGTSSTHLSSFSTDAPAETSVGHVGVAATAAGEPKQSMGCSVLEEVQALQQQLYDAQHPEVGTLPTSAGMHKSTLNMVASIRHAQMS